MPDPLSFHDTPEPSARGFGVLFAVIALALAVFPVFDTLAPRLVSGGCGLVLGLVSLIAPSILLPAARAWQGLSLLLGHIVTPLVMFLIFALTVVPIGLMMRLAGKDPLRIGKMASTTFWLPRDEQPTTMRDQF